MGRGDLTGWHSILQSSSDAFHFLAELTQWEYLSEKEEMKREASWLVGGSWPHASSRFFFYVWIRRIRTLQMGVMSLAHPQVRTL